MSITDYIEKHFGCTLPEFVEALENSPSSRGYVLGALSEILLKKHLELAGYDVIRIVEKPSGGNDAKNDEARGDFYIRRVGETKDEWYIVESKGLKSNSEFRGEKFNSAKKLLRFLKPLVFPNENTKVACYDKGKKSYDKSKTQWESENPGKTFPEFRWTNENPGPVTCDLSSIWTSENDLKEYLEGLDESKFTEEAYRSVKGAVAVLETHKPSTRIDPVTNIKQAAPLTGEFCILSVDLFLRTGKHEFVFLNPLTISHSPTSPNHLYQNYTIDILIPGIKDEPTIKFPWFRDIDLCIDKTNPQKRPIDRTQIDQRSNADSLNT